MNNRQKYLREKIAECLEGVDIESIQLETPLNGPEPVVSTDTNLIPPDPLIETITIEVKRHTVHAIT